MPGYWMHETSGVLRPAIEAYLRNEEPMSADHIAAMRAYLRQWIAGPWVRDGLLDALTEWVGRLDSREAIAAWLELADEAGIDPL